MQLLDEQPKRMALERRLLTEHAQSNKTFDIEGWGTTASGELCVNFRLQPAGRNFDGVLVYPQLFPDVPAFIRPKNSGEAWSQHQYLVTGVLCLEYGPDNWHPGITGVDLVRSANKLLWGETLTALLPSLAPVPSRHSSAPGQDIRNSGRRLLVTPDLRRALVAAGTAAPVSLKVAVGYLAERSVAVVTAIGTPVQPIPDVPLAISSERFEWSGWAVAVDLVKALGAVENFAALKQSLGAAWPWSEEVSGELRVLLVHDREGNLRLFSLADGDEPFCGEYRAMDFENGAEQRLPVEYGELSNTTVAIVGLGSLGSKMAVSLARAGVRRFLLVDDDIVGPYNLVRHELNWLDVGFSKVGAVKRELSRISAGMDVRVLSIRVAGQENPLVAADRGQQLAKCTLIVDATANPQAFAVLAAIANRASVPMVWGKVFGGGTGGLMARSRPGLDADALAVHGHIRGAMQTLAPLPEHETSDYGLEVEGRVYVASDADVTSIAASMTQFALDTLCAGTESNYPVAAYLIGFRKYWEFKGPFDTIPIDCSAAIRQAPEVAALTGAEQDDLDELRKAIGECGSAANNGTP